MPLAKSSLARIAPRQPATLHGAFSTDAAATLANGKTPLHGGYSIEKFLALQRYVESTPPWRVAMVMLVTPVPGLIGALLPSLVPLQDPRAGARGNPGYFVSMLLLCFIIQTGTLILWRAGAELPPRLYRFRHVVIAALVTTLTQSVFVTAVAFAWRFPIPMSWIVASSVTGTCLTLGHLAAFGKRCWQDNELIDGIKRYVPALTFQSIQIIIYPAFSILFDHATQTYQVLLTLAFPIVKFFMKRGLRKYTWQLKDFSTVVAVAGIEICASLYQSMILQNSPSRVALMIIMSVDVLQGLAVVKLFMDRPTSVPHDVVIRVAVRQLEAYESTRREVDRKLQQQKEVERSESTRVLPNSVEAIKSMMRSDQRASAQTETREQEATKVEDLPPAVTQALQLVSVAESILLVEYLEVVVPIINAIFVAVSCQFSTAQYNTRLRRLYFEPGTLHTAVRSIVLYSLLQALSFVAIHLVMKYRYRVSSVYYLAFILEYHWQSIVGKMIGWLPIILHFSGVHFGVDFSFKFDFEALLQKAYAT